MTNNEEKTDLEEFEKDLNADSFNNILEFSLKDPSKFKFGGVYFIVMGKPDGRKEVVKIGQSQFVYQRIVNYFLENTSDKSSSKRNTKRTIQKGIKKGEELGAKFYITWQVLNNEKERKNKERRLINQFETKYDRKPLFHNQSKIPDSALQSMVDEFTREVFNYLK